MQNISNYGPDWLLWLQVNVFLVTVEVNERVPRHARPASSRQLLFLLLFVRVMFPIGGLSSFLTCFLDCLFLSLWLGLSGFDENLVGPV